MFPARWRPSRLSNRNCCYSNEDIAAIGEKDIAALSWRDFEAIFALSGCTAEYDEQLYYVPLGLAYLKEHPADGNEFMAGLVYFVASNQERLSEDGFLDGAIAEFRACFHRWTSRFTVIHFDAEACAAKGWRIEHSDYVENSWSLRELVDILLRYGLSTLAEEMVESWLQPSRRLEDSAWLLEFSKEEREAYDYYSREEPHRGIST